MPLPNIVLPEVATSKEVMAWPEFRALMKRLGIDSVMPIRSLTLKIGMGEVVTLEINQLGIDANKDKPCR